MDVTEAVRTRRSHHHLTDPAPDDARFTHLLRTAAAAPDHGRLRPWRWVLLRGPQRRLLGEALAAGRTGDAADRAALKTQRAPLLASIVLTPRHDSRIPRWEQLAATAALVHALELLLHGDGWGSIWRTGPGVKSPAVREALRLAPDEQLLGWLYIGTPESGHAARAPKPVGDVADRVTRIPGPGEATGRHAPEWAGAGHASLVVP